MKIDIDGVQALLEPADLYLQIDDLPRADFARIWAKIKAGYAAYDKWFCYHNTDVPQDMLRDIGAVLRDDCAEMRLRAGSFDLSDVPDAERISDGSFAEFAAYHDARNPDMYWTGERIGRDLSRWAIFVSRFEGRISGYVLLEIGSEDQSEIYAADGEDCARLMRRAAKFAFAAGKSEVLYMADAGSTGQRAAIEAGFVAVGVYKGYAVKGHEPSEAAIHR